jgi:hypothetical protein
MGYQAGYSAGAFDSNFFGLLVMKQQMQVFKFHWSLLVKTQQTLVNQIFWFIWLWCIRFKFIWV